MKKKLNQQAGLTLIEMLVATAILILLTMMLGTGLSMTVNSYRKVVAQSEVDLLLSTAMDALADDLRFARDIKDDGGLDDSAPDDDSDSDAVDYVSYAPFTYTSDSFVGMTHLELIKGSAGSLQIMATEIDPESHARGESKRFLSTGAYGGKPDKGTYAYEVTRMEITHDTEENAGKVTNYFTIDLEVQALADRDIKASGKVKIRCLN